MFPSFQGILVESTNRFRRTAAAIFLVAGFITTHSEEAPTLAQALTHLQSDGNRILSGSVDIRQFGHRDLPLNGVPHWLVGTPYRNGALWVAAMGDGSLQGWALAGAQTAEVPLTPDRLAPGTPPLVVVRNDVPTILQANGSVADFTHPILLSDNQTVAYLDPEANLVVERSDESWTLALNALPDARLVSDGHSRIAILTDPTDAYRHAVLGDALEARAITLVDTRPTPHIQRTITIPEPWVIEGLSPLWADLNGDHERELIVTLSSPSDGGKIVVYSEAGDLVAEGPGIGRGFRWRNQMAVAPYAPDGSLELTAVRTPHIGGTVEFYRWEGEHLIIAAALRGFTSHVIRSRNLDLSVSGKFLSSDPPVVIVPNDARNVLHLIQHTDNGAQSQHTLALGSRLASNLAAVTLPDQSLALAAGLENQSLRIWAPSAALTKVQIAINETNDHHIVNLIGAPDQSYTLQTSEDFIRWQDLQHVHTSADTASTALVLPITDTVVPQFLRAIDPATENLAHVVAAAFTPLGDGFRATVTIRSVETGCDHYANWWEILSPSGELIFRRLLAHSHVSEQPFTRSGSPVMIQPSDRIWIRAHMHPNGYGGMALTGSIEQGFVTSPLPPDFAAALADQAPLPTPCAF